MHLPSVSVGYRTVWGCTALVALCAADVFSAEPASFPLHTLFSITGCGLGPGLNLAVQLFPDRIKGSKVQKVHLVMYHGSFVSFAWFWMRPHKTLNHFGRLNHYVATFQLLSLVISIILFVYVNDEGAAHYLSPSRPTCTTQSRKTISDVEGIINVCVCTASASVINMMSPVSRHTAWPQCYKDK